MPDRQAARHSLQRVGVRVHQDIVLNSSTLLDAREAVVVLPAATRYEQKGGGTSTSTERRIRYSPEIPGPRIAEARAEWEVLAAVGRATVPEAAAQLTYRDASDVRKEMGELIPLYEGIEDLSREGDWVQWGGPQLGRDGFGHMPGGRARFADVTIPRIDVPEGRLLLALRRGKQFNSITYGDHDPLLDAKRSDIVLDPRDLLSLGLHEGDAVVVRSDLAALQARVRSGPCRRGHVQGYWPELNALVQRHYDQASGEPDYTTTVSIERA